MPFEAQPFIQRTPIGRELLTPHEPINTSGLPNSRYVRIGVLDHESERIVSGWVSEDGQAFAPEEKKQK